MSKTIVWHGCYDDSWRDLIVEGAFAHPAKFALGLIRRIYQHCFERGYLRPGDTVVDPFGGVALGALDAMMGSVHWVGCELEPRFVKLAEENIAFWHAHHPKGTARIVCGDSRRLCELVGPVLAEVIVSSPPYVESVSATGHGIDWSKAGPATGNRRRGEGTQCEETLRAQLAYGKTPGQLGAMPAGSIDAVVSSPPYAETLKGDGTQAETAEESRAKRRTEGGSLGQSQRTQGYGSAGNLGNLPTGSVEAVVSSPPYAGSLQNDGQKRANFSDGRDRNIESSWQGMDYGPSPQNLGNLPAGEPPRADAVVGSPPYENAIPQDKRGASDLKIARQCAEKYGRIYTDKSFRPVDYGDTEGNIGTATGDTFWSAAREIVRQCHQILKPGGVCVWVLRAFVRNKALVDFPGQWRTLCEACGFEFVEEIHASLVKERRDAGLFGGEVVKRKERKSFFRRLAEKKGSPRIDHEVVLILRRSG